MLGRLDGIQIVTSTMLTEYRQVRFPRSKRRRIREKWAKRTSNWSMVPSDAIYQMGDRLIMHPATAAKLFKRRERRKG